MIAKMYQFRKTAGFTDLGRSLLQTAEKALSSGSTCSTNNQNKVTVVFMRSISRSYCANCDVNTPAGKFNPHSASLMPYICSFSFLWQLQRVRYVKRCKKIYTHSLVSLSWKSRYGVCLHVLILLQTLFLQPAPHPASTNHTSPSSIILIAPSLLPTLCIPLHLPPPTILSPPPAAKVFPLVSLP